MTGSRLHNQIQQQANKTGKGHHLAGQWRFAVWTAQNILQDDLWVRVRSGLPIDIYDSFPTHPYPPPEQ